MKTRLFTLCLLFAAACAESDPTPKVMTPTGEVDAFLRAKYHRDPTAPKICWKFAWFCRDCGWNNATGGPVTGSVLCEHVPPESIVETAQ
jgi:hypothetical protein